ncbi:diacylglycerol kinase [Gordonia hongkongensis]|uniref:NAD(P)H-dependent amine dehydrogenase family protein n=1 Tax=Gordonia hongkongensis TaxID=1701090 RepID=UPI001FF97B6E|nr:diacylglycerol kinase [Gordonia hongkongensis]UPG66546.1 diacylglycerol kinase [Gordonia hongkongensis]
MSFRVALVGTGNVGRLCLTQLIEDPRFELVAVCVSTPEKVGVDAATLAGLETPTGVLAVGDLDEVIATKPDCVVYCAMGDTRPVEAFDDVLRILVAGIDVVGSSPNTLQYPWDVMPAKAIAKIDETTAGSGASLFVTGVDPGFANDLIPFVFAGTCQHIEQVRCMEIADYATYDGATVMFDVMGFGKPLDETPMLFLPGVLGLAWGTTIRQLAAGLGVTVDDIEEISESEPAPEDFDIAAGHIAAGTRAAVRFEIIGKVAGEPVIVIEHVTRLRGDLRPDWAQPAQPGGCYRVEITGEPSYTVDIMPTSRKGDHNHAAIVAAAGRIVNAIPAVVDGPAGLRTTLDLPLVTGPGVSTGSTGG